jgi:vesicular inhibitory amino acid transporter
MLHGYISFHQDKPIRLKFLFKKKMISYDENSLGEGDDSGIEHSYEVNTNTHCGSLSLSESTFNAVNVLVGIGMLALPFSFKLTGWVMGILILVFMSFLTSFTARLVIDCLEYKQKALEEEEQLLGECEKKPLMTYSDIGFVAFGNSGRLFISVLFTFELFAATVALIILISQTLHPLFKDYLSENIFKLIVVCVITWPVYFKTLKVASYISFLVHFN